MHRIMYITTSGRPKVETWPRVTWREGEVVTETSQIAYRWMRLVDLKTMKSSAWADLVLFIFYQTTIRLALHVGPTVIYLYKLFPLLLL